MFFQIEDKEIKGYSPVKENLQGKVVEADLPESFDPETHYLKNLKWDGKKVVFDPTWKLSQPATVDDKLRVLAKKVLNKTLDSHEQKILTDLMEALK